MTKLDTAFLEHFTDTIGPIGKSLGMLIRPSFVAAESKQLVWGDWSAIEARVLPWLATSPGAEKVLDIFRLNDADKNLPDIYELTAGELLGKPAGEVTKAERQSHGKVPVLSLGFGGGKGALQKMAVNYRVYFDEPAAEALVTNWRGRNQWAPDFWGVFRTDNRSGEVERATGLWGAVNMALRNPGTAYPAGRVAYVFDPSYMDGTLFCALPCGRLLTYPDCKLRTRSLKDKDTGEVTEKTAIWYRKGYGWSALWHGKCLAGGTLVATDRGWIAISDVRSADQLWDGEEWVQHQGLLYQGSKSTVPVDGVRMTPDHEVLTDDGWKQAAQLEGFHRAAVRLPDRAAAGTAHWARRQRAVVGALLLRYGEDGIERWLAEGEPKTVAAFLRLRNQQAHRRSAHDTRHDEAPGLRGVAVHERPLQASDASGVEELRWARDHGLPPVAALVRDFLGGHGADLPAGADAGAEGQRPGLLAGELQVGDVGGAGKEPSHPVAEPVYDLLNAGPRRRFVVLGESGPMIVHNCAENITQAVAGSILRETLVELDKPEYAFMPTVGSTHDEVVTEVDENPATVARAELVLENVMGVWRPDWRKDLPLVAEVVHHDFYTKSIG